MKSGITLDFKVICYKMLINYKVIKCSFVVKIPEDTTLMK
jgi:hypothetical protein